MEIDYTEITVKLMEDYTAKYLQENAELVQNTIKATQEALAISRVSCQREQLMAMLEERIQTIKSEPDGIVRETMIDNLLIDINCN